MIRQKTFFYRSAIYKSRGKKIEKLSCNLERVHWNHSSRCQTSDWLLLGWPAHEYVTTDFLFPFVPYHWDESAICNFKVLIGSGLLARNSLKKNLINKLWIDNEFIWLMMIVKWKYTIIEYYKDLTNGIILNEN